MAKTSTIKGNNDKYYSDFFINDKKLYNNSILFFLDYDIIILDLITYKMHYNYGLVVRLFHNDSE